MHLDIVRRVCMPEGRDLRSRPEHHFAVNLLAYYAAAIVLLQAIDPFETLPYSTSVGLITFLS